MATRPDRRGRTAPEHALARALRESEERFRLMVEGSERVFFYVHDAEGRFEYLSESVREVLGYAPEDLVGEPYDVLLTGDLSDVVVREATGAALLGGGGRRTYPALVRHRDGRAVVLELTEGPVARRGRARGIQGFARDITDRKRAEERLAHGALHDPLTGFPNRTLFVDRLAHALARARRVDSPPFAVLFVDIDRFQVVNDSLGHGVGDELLLAAGRRLEATLRSGDTIARFAGDVFTLLLDSVPDPVAATHIAERLQASLARPFHLDGQEVYLTASIGIALHAGSDTTPEELLRDADTALGRAKSRGAASSEVFDHRMHAEATRRLRMETDLRHALARDELFLVYQPIVRAGSGEIAGLEALLRWRRADGALVRPDEFIPVAEQTGEIVAIGEWVLREACGYLRRHNDTAGGAALTMSVNVSARQITQPRLVERFEEILREEGVRPDLLRIELTESVMIEHAGVAAGVFRRLRALGVQLSLDDFGTGYSSLAHLQEFPLDTLKIDRSFVNRIGTDERSLALIRAIVGLARSLGMSVVAEGVETDAQLAGVEEVGCDYAQGFGISKPLAAEEVTRLLARGSSILPAPRARPARSGPVRRR